MNKGELIAAISEKSGQSKVASGAVLEALIETITETLQAGEDVTLVGFGTFARGERAARTGRNPRTGAEIKIAAAKTATFKAGKALKDAVNTKAKKKK